MRGDGMEHSFDIEIAQKYGIEEAIILKHFHFWIQKNEANDDNYFEGKYWTYNSVKAFTELFPYMTERKIRSTLAKMEEQGLIITGNFNKSQYDRTKWYALTDLAYSILQKGNFHLTKTENGSDKNVRPIPDINTDINTDNNTVSKDTVRQTEVRRVIDAWNSLSDCGINPVQRIHSGTKRYDSLVARIREYGVDEVLNAVERIRRSKFLQGKTEGRRQWTIKFDWFVLPNNFLKVLEGNYDDENVDTEQFERPKGQYDEIWERDGFQ